MGHGGAVGGQNRERDRIYALPEMSEEDGYKVADLEVKYGEDGRLFR
ncbi:heme ABC transporter ATP-binding protein [Salmonella enterica subsp. arizonae]|uniref:Heme ABC transporter ATP-binding protein n=1 Tax=Salmonella enterica subsp. arizonae TaxID=59203 RepID=A0A379TEQ6_SALER|nr:heme ABC transporter ATP-binding protein [Salmonella enterica subsp. arizonae]